ncbi:MAG TPA: hypothetical protein VFZ66_29880 [Herpetosiphonaceae bacterium]
MKLTIDVNIGDVLSVLDKADPEPLARVIGVAVAEEVRNEVTPYPLAARKPQPFTSAKQRRFFFAALKKGQITVPYRRGSDPRSETLGRKWIIQPGAGGATLTNTASYSDLVQNKKKQAPYHKGVWTTDEDAARKVEQSGVAAKIAEDVITRRLT